MKIFLTGFFTAFLALSALAGGGDYSNSPQQQLAPPVLVVPQPTPPKDGSPVVPIVAAILGAAGLVGAAYISRGKNKGN